ncbi:hypothetical protein WDU94_010931 [Cyamophila willieti]
MCDLSRAFECLSHQILLSKLKHYKFDAASINMLSSYLEGRSQQVRVGDQLSQSRNVTIGIPTGSITGPLLFLLYINDLPVNLPGEADGMLFADDSTLFVHSDSEHSVLSKSEQCLMHVKNNIHLYPSQNDIHAHNTRNSRDLVLSKHRVNKAQNGPNHFGILFYNKLPSYMPDGRSTVARRLYQEKFPNRHVPNQRTFVDVHRRLRERGTFRTSHLGNSGTARTARTVDIEEQILEAVDDDPTISTRQLSKDLNVSHSTVWRTLHENLFYPYHLQRVQGLLERDVEPRLQFCRWALVQLATVLNFLSSVLFTDEAKFNRDGITNFHNNHIWATENPHGLVQKKTTNKHFLLMYGQA